MKYDPKHIEQKWQQYWQEKKTYQVKIDHDRPKYYVLDMFPYPSGAGLHVGHVTGYTGTDVIARYMRMKGYNVLHPMAWDSFGLPAEQYAIRTGTHPRDTTEKNIDTYRRQLMSLGFSYDWDREFATSDPNYYKWTQWIFSKLYEKGLAYEAEMQVNYCPALATVLANEEVEDGKSVEGGYPIERRPLRQWILKITEYAERLLDDLDALDWPESLKNLQRNWIGRSEGVDIGFKVKGRDEVITCFTTRHDTLFGVTYLVLAPEHPLADQLTLSEKKDELLAYQKAVATKSDLARTELAKDKTGVFTGSYAINPITDETIPIWIADYVLASYGTGAVLAVPAHDDRDVEFAKKYDLPIVPVLEDNEYINSENEKISLRGLTLDQAKEKIAVYLEKEGLGKRRVNYKLRDWLFSRQRYWGEPIPILHFEDGSMRSLDIDELPLTPPTIDDYKPSETGESPLKKVTSWVEIIDPKTGKKAFRETNTMPQWAGSCWYYLRLCDPKNQELAWSDEAQKYWLPVDLYVGGVEHAVLHLLYVRFWHKVLYDSALVSTKEPFKKFRNQGLVTAHSYKKAGGGYVNPQNIEERNGVLFDKDSNTQVSKLLEKMSKSKLNGVSPDEIIEEFGADALRLYEMFMTPFDKEKIWQTDAVSGCKRFLNRFFDLVTSSKVSDETSDEALKLGYRLVQGIEEDLKTLSFNTAIAKMMEFINHFIKLPSYPRKVLKMATQMLYPFAPHFGEECWEILGGKDTISFEPIPEIDLSYLVENTVTVIFQVNGKLRGKSEFALGASKQEVIEKAKMDPSVQRHIEGKTLIKEIFVPDKLVNIVVK